MWFFVGWTSNRGVSFPDFWTWGCASTQGHGSTSSKNDETNKKIGSRYRKRKIAPGSRNIKVNIGLICAILVISSLSVILLYSCSRIPEYPNLSKQNLCTFLIGFRGWQQIFHFTVLVKFQKLVPANLKVQGLLV